MNPPDLVFKQRNVSTKVEITFHPDFLEYYISDQKGRRGVNVKYESMPNAFDYRAFRPKDIFIRSLLGVTAGMTLFEVSLRRNDLYETMALTAGVGLVFLAIGYGLRKLLVKERTVLAVEKTFLHIIKDHQHSEIMREIEARRTAALKKFAVIDRSQPIWFQIKKFKWLKDEGVISNDAFIAYRDTLLTEPSTEADIPRSDLVLH